MNKAETRKTIIDAAIEILEKEGFHKFTIDKVAKFMKKDMNYIFSYFPDANTLIDDALSQTLFTGLEENINQCQEKYKKASDFLHHLFTDTLAGSLNYPKILKSHFYSAFVLEMNDSDSIKKLRRFIDKIWKIIEPSIQDSKKDAARRKLDQALASIFFIGLFPTVFQRPDYSLWINDLASSIIER